MSLHRFYLPPEQCQGTTVTLGGREAHHALQVLRTRQGSRIVLLDGAGRELLCEVQETGRESLQLTVLEKRHIPPPPCQITLLPGLPKGKLIETIIQKATELGAWRVVPLLSERVITRIQDEADAAHKQTQWQQAAIEAIKQCGAAWLPKVEAPMTPKQFLARREQIELPFLGSLQANAKHPREYFQDFRRKHGRMPSSTCVWIGPEGDFSADEIQELQSAGALPITLGRLVLRTDTAAMYCLSVINYELQALG